MDKLLRNKKAIFVFVAPALILFTAVLFIPIGTSFYYALCDYDKVTRSYSFIGFGNFINLAKDKDMFIALKNSLFFLVFSCVSQLIMGLLLAALLTNIKVGRNLFKNVIYLPCVLSSAALGLLWAFLFHAKVGINNLLANFGIQGPAWLYSTSGFITLPMWVIAFVSLWQYVGQSMMLYMAQISGINKTLYEASYIDGATKMQAFRYITLPLVKPMIGTAMSLNAIGSLKFFDLIYSMLGDKTENLKMDVLATFLYRTGFSSKGGNHYGKASAIGVILVALCLLATAIINKLFKTENYEM
ncbi:MAG TPA: sugar ABC transporter permease [Lachnospiraceae bacterium]|nr:sugar ABC transporter permease [Lachnospiraceae bacterium]